MVIFRALLAPMVVVVALRLTQPEFWLGALIATACLSDIFDGILARRWGTATAALRISDTTADTIFYLSVLAAIVIRHWPVLQQWIGLLAALLGLEAIRAAFDWIKFRKMASYHTYTAKIWGLLLALATIALLCFDRGFWLLPLALIWGILCDLEGLAISAILPEWAHDVKSIRSALKVRAQMRAHEYST
jgi:CDP-diacylglycerol--glycerol-3-phosphate 3-phosphatidyltransferase